MLLIAFMCLFCGNPGWAVFWALIDGHSGWAFFFFIFYLMKDDNLKVIKKKNINKNKEG